MCSTMLVKVLREQARQSLFVSQLFPNFIPASSESSPSKCAIFDIETKAVIPWGKLNLYICQYTMLLHTSSLSFLKYWMKSFVLSLGQLVFDENWKRILLCSALSAELRLRRKMSRKREQPNKISIAKIQQKYIKWQNMPNTQDKTEKIQLVAQT